MGFAAIHERALARKGGPESLSSLLPHVATPLELIELADDRYLAEITRCVFRAGFVWKVIDNKWSGFEAAFDGFVPRYWQQVSPEVLENLASDTRIIRNFQKIRTVPENARMVVDAAQEYGSFGHMLAQWPSTDQAGLLLWLKRHGSRLGGNTPQYFLRLVGWDGFILTSDVVAVLRLEGLMDATPGSKKALLQAQAAFNEWHRETGLPYSHLSKIASCSIER